MKTTLKSKLCYASGDIYGGAAFLVFSLLYMNFLVLVEQVPVVWASAIIFIGKIWDAVTDPIVGNISDRTKSRYGRRRFYFLLGIAPVFISFITLFYSFSIDNINIKIVYHTFAYMFFGTAFTIVMVPYNAILSEMTSDYNERTSYTTVRMLVSASASLVAAVVPSMIIKAVGGEENGPGQKNGYLVMAIILALIFALCWLVTFLGTRERVGLATPMKVTIREWLTVFDNKSYRIFLGIFISFQVAIDLVLAIFIFYVDIVILRYESYELIIGVLLVCSILFMPVQGYIAKKKGKVFPLFIGLPIWIASALSFVFLNTSTPVIVICGLAFLIAIGSSAGNLTTWSALTDIYDVDEIITGKRREGIYSGFTTFMRKFSSGFAVLLLGFGLERMGFDQNEYNILKSKLEDFNPETYARSDIVTGIKWMFILIPVILLIITLIFAARYKINNSRFDTLIKGIDLFKQKGNIDEMSAEEVADIELLTGKNKKDLWKISD
ncbi:MAG: MFS transporter [Christensenellales bacterium]|jgi:oligogalacturonide transporter